jgi:hypothetical protein
MDERGTAITEAMREYAGPLIVGESPIRIAADGLPEFIRFRRQPIGKKLVAWS